MPPSPACTACPVHGRPTKRDSCQLCNAAYMRDYMRRRRTAKPEKLLLERARRRASDSLLPFSLSEADIVIPRICPALGIPIRLDEGRSPNSPSLDKIVSCRGYVPDNVRVISDRANRLKGDRDTASLQALSVVGPQALRAGYALLAQYVSRELFLSSVREKAERRGRAGREWREVASLLDKLFAVGLVEPRA